jgi:multicomponent Na+:H+ antiporter subunit B
MNGMSIIVKTTANLVIPLIFLFAFYVIIYGHLLPGEGFDGGCLIAATLTLYVLTHGKEEVYKKFGLKGTTILASVFGLLLIILGICGIIFGKNGELFSNFLGMGEKFNVASGGIIPIFNVLLGIGVGMAIYAHIIALFSEGDKEDEE